MDIKIILEKSNGKLLVQKAKKKNTSMEWNDNQSLK